MADGSTDNGGLPGWTGVGQNDFQWNRVILGDYLLAGICTVHSVECGVDVDHKKIKGADKPTSKDTGIKVAKFVIDQWIKSYQINDAATIIRVLGPHQPGKPRGPVGITHPLPNMFGIEDVRITDIEVPRSPTSRSGMHILWKIEQWFDAPVAAKTKDKVASPLDTARGPSTAGGETTSDFARHEALRQLNEDSKAEDLDPTTFQPLKPSSNAISNLFNSLGGFRRAP